MTTLAATLWAADPAMAAPVLAFAKPVLNPFAIVFGDDADVRKKASPLNHVHKGLPPFLPAPPTA